MSLIIASNASPYKLLKQGEGYVLEKSPGGLVSALDPIMKDKKGVWVCSGDDNFGKYPIELPYKIEQIKFTKNEKIHHYDGYCNRQLWPLFHYFPTRYQLNANDWNYYKNVNQKFANTLENIITPNDKIWIQDYHLMILPKLLRDKGIKNKIGFFLHIPFPNWEVFRILPNRKDILEGLLASDVVGFHTQSYQRHFIECIKNKILSDIQFTNKTIIFKEREIKLVALPISIDFDLYDQTARSPYVLKKSKELIDNFTSPLIGLGVDRLDYSKGIIERLEGYEYFLENNPEYIKKITFVQIATPTRTGVMEYNKIKKMLDETVGRINGMFSKDGWVPICYINEHLNPMDLVSYYVCANFLVVSALRDGLNLVSKEYIASRIYNDGVLVLSEFTGAAEELDTSVKINPYNVKSIANGILSAVTMSESDQNKFMIKMREHISINNIHKWVEDFLCEL